MKAVFEGLVGCLGEILLRELVVICIVSYLLRIHGRCRCFDWSTKTKVSIALLIDEVLDLLLAQTCGVHGDLIVHWLCTCRGWVLIWHEIEVEELLVIRFNNTSIHQCPRAWIDVIAILLLEEADGLFLVDEDIENLRVVVWSVVLDELHDLWELIL